MKLIIQPCSLGQALIVASQKNTLMGLELGNSIEDCYRLFITRWDKSGAKKLITPDRPDPALVSSVLDIVDNRSPKMVPVVLVGTPFQQEVWKALSTIPEGETRNYKQIAEQIGLPKAVRAVANAIGANPIAIIVPCHRVVRSDGTLGGYRWGEEIKKQLLSREAHPVRLSLP